MATKIRFSRHGSKKKPFYWLVVTDARAPRDGQFIEKLGTYNPLLAKDNDNRVSFNKERINYWLSTGAQPTEKAEKLFNIEGIKIDFKQKTFRKQYDPSLAVKKLSKKATLRAAEEAKKSDEERAAEALAAQAAKEAAEAQVEAEVSSVNEDASEIVQDVVEAIEEASSEENSEDK